MVRILHGPRLIAYLAPSEIILAFNLLPFNIIIITVSIPKINSY